jgi:hypothetical protein
MAAPAASVHGGGDVGDGDGGGGGGGVCNGEGDAEHGTLPVAPHGLTGDHVGAPINAVICVALAELSSKSVAALAVDSKNRVCPGAMAAMLAPDAACVSASGPRGGTKSPV